MKWWQGRIQMILCFFTFSSYLCVCSVAQLCPTLCTPARLLCPWGFSRQEYWSELPCLLQGIFLTQGSNLQLQHLLLCRRILYHWATLYVLFILVGMELLYKRRLVVQCHFFGLAWCFDVFHWLLPRHLWNCWTGERTEVMDMGLDFISHLSRWDISLLTLSVQLLGRRM